ncbi:MAG: hypothetical protein FWE02_02115 [Defluviitaleaceae bacterium]|nr:hypothetical protein [Defluviitaleaceae bacterium]
MLLILIAMIAIFALSIGLVTLRWYNTNYLKNKDKSCYDKILSFFCDVDVSDKVIALLFGVLGALFALWGADLNANRIDRENTTTIFNILREEIKDVQLIIEFFLEGIQVRQEQIVDDDHILYFYNSQPIVPSFVFSVAMNDELVITNTNKLIYFHLLSAYRALVTSFMRIENVSSVEDLISELETLYSSKQFVYEIIALQLHSPSLRNREIKTRINQLLESYK